MVRQGKACQAGRAMKHKLEEERKLNPNRLCLGDKGEGYETQKVM